MHWTLTKFLADEHKAQALRRQFRKKWTEGEKKYGKDLTAGGALIQKNSGSWKANIEGPFQ